MQCACSAAFRREAIEEWEEDLVFLRYRCERCGFGVGIETDLRNAGLFFDGPVWTDEARHRLERLPPYVEPLVRQEVEAYAGGQGLTVLSTDLMTEAGNHGKVAWHPDATRRLSRIPGPVRAMARVELERTALDRGLSEVTVELMDEIKARYFGMATPGS